MKAKFLRVVTILIIAILVLIGILTWKTQIRSNYYQIYGNFDNAAKVSKDADVCYRGVKIGFVKEIKLRLDLSAAEATISIDSKVKIPTKSVLRIVFDGLLGTKYIEIVPPETITDSFIKPGSTLEGETPVSFNQLLNQVITSLKNVEKLVATLNKIDIEGINKTIHEAREICQQTRSAIEKFEDKSILTLDSLISLSNRLGKVANDLEFITSDEKLKKDLKETITNFQKISKGIRKLIFWSK